MEVQQLQRCLLSSPSKEPTAKNTVDWRPPVTPPVELHRTHFVWAATSQWLSMAGTQQPGLFAHYGSLCNGQPLLQDPKLAWPRLFQNCAEVWSSSYSSLLPSFSSFTGVNPSSWFEASPHLLLLPPSLYFKSVSPNKLLAYWILSYSLLLRGRHS